MKLCADCQKPLVYVVGAQTLYFGQGSRLEVKAKELNYVLCENCRRKYDDGETILFFQKILNDQRIRDIKKIMEKK